MIYEKLKNLIRVTLRTLLRVNIIRGTLRWLAKKGVLRRSIWRRFPAEAEFYVNFGAGQFKYNSSASDSIGRILYWGGEKCWESESTFLFSKLAQNANFTLDIGANTGTYSLISLSANASNRVIAFEPIPRLKQRLIRNLEINNWGNRCVVRPEAVSNKSGRAKFHIPALEMPTTGSLHTEGFQGLNGQLVDVELITTDQAVSSKNTVDLIKMDIEGFEHHALEGMQRILSRDKPIILLECNEGGPNEQIRITLDPFGYNFFHIRENGLISSPTITPDPTGQFRNFLCVPTEKLDMINTFLGSQ